MRQTRIQIARPDIVRYFDENPRKIYRLVDIASVLSLNRSFWRLTQSMTSDEFLGYLVKSTKLRRLEFPFKRRKEIRYVWGEVPALEVIQALYPKAFFSHYAAVRFHGLTEQLPKTLYLNVEQPARGLNTDPTQRSVDAAFTRKPRITSNVATFADYNIYQINGKDSGQLGVIDRQVPDIESDLSALVRVTGVERTLIDIAVRPMYAGGVHEVLKAYEMASGAVSINRLAAMLKQLNFTYPYHQAIGFYIEKCGAYSESSLQIIRSLPKSLDFYLTYQMSDRAYVADWRLWVPKGMEL